jgi:class 3 adenylate cyclase
VVADLVEGKPYLFSDRGEAALKGFERPVRLFELKWRRA